MPDFLPRREADLLAWSANFSARIAESPEAYGMSAAEAAAFAATQTAFAQAYRLATAPESRGPSKVARKNTARDAMMREARELAGVVRARRGTTDQQLLDLGLRTRGGSRQRVPRPVESPRIRLGKVDGLRVRLRVMETETGRCRKPRDVAVAVLFYALGEQPTSAESPSWRRWGATGRLRVERSVPAGTPAGTRVWVTGYWMNERGEGGPWADPVSTHAGGGVSAIGGAGDSGGGTSGGGLRLVA